MVAVTGWDGVFFDDVGGHGARVFRLSFAQLLDKESGNFSSHLLSVRIYKCGVVCLFTPQHYIISL